MLALRIVRNLLSHMQGSVKGLSQPSLECLSGLVSEALRVLATALGGDHPALFDSLGEHAGKA